MSKRSELKGVSRIPIYGRRAVLAVLQDQRIQVDRLTVVESANSPILSEILGLAESRGVSIRRASSKQVARMSGNAQQHQGVMVDVQWPRLRTLDNFLNSTVEHKSRAVLVLDGVTTPANVGMIVRSAVATGLSGVVIPSMGNADLVPMMIKASAGTAVSADILRCENAVDGVRALKSKGFHIYGLAPTGQNELFTADLVRPAAYLLGNESEGLSNEVSREVDDWISIPTRNEVESLNVACAATLLCYELLRRDRPPIVGKE